MSAAVTEKTSEPLNDVQDFTNLVKDLKAKIIEMKKQVKPLKEKAESGEIHTSKGVSFLEIKYQMMLQYVLELAFFVHLKLSGKSVEGHAVIESLVELRVVLDRMKPIEGKLKYQIDKLVRAAVMGAQQQKSDEKAAATVEVEADPLAFKPNPTNLLARDVSDDEDDDDQDDATDGVYRPPKLAPVSYDENAGRKSGKKERDEMRLKEKASRSRLMKDLMSEMSENPEEIGVFGGVNEGTGYGDRIDNVIAEKNQYEEDNYVRLSVTRKEKKRMNSNKKMRFESEFDNLNDFSNLAGIHQVEEEENERFRNVLNRKKQKAESGYNKRSREDNDDGGDNDDDDLPTGKSVNKFQKARKRKARGKKH